MSDKPFGLLELGTNSLKFYLVELKSGAEHTVKTHKFPWRVGHDYFSTGQVSEETIRGLIATIRGVETVSAGVPLTSMLTVATGVFRELTDIANLATRVMTDAGVRLRVITGEDEARLMAKGFPASTHLGSHLLCDLGGATTEWAWIVDGRCQRSGSLRLGAIRNEYKLGRWRHDHATYLARNAEVCAEALTPIAVRKPTAVMATGGTAKAIAAVAGKLVVPLEELRALVDRVLKDGPPATLKPERQAVFLPGLAILERLCSHCGSSALEYAQTSVRDGMAQRLIQLLGSHRRQDLHSTLLLNTRGA